MLVVFYFGPGSRYSYLAATQLDALSRETSARFRWRPVLSADLVARTGGPRSPQDPAWRLQDVQRWAAHYGVPFRDPPDCDWRRLALACTAAGDRVEAFAKALYTVLFVEGQAVGDAQLAEIAMRVGLDGGALIAAIDSCAVAERYAADLAMALAAGAWGVPSFVTENGELVWGQDRLPLLRDLLRVNSRTPPRA